MEPTIDTDEKKKFRSFAVLDLETSNLPELQCFKVGITELSVYGIAINEFNRLEESDVNQPELPRVLHKLKLMINPMMAIHPYAERVTGLNNYMLENESKFDENVGNILLSFLKNLQQPVCLVAHNGYPFDFPILKHVLERIDMSVPSDMYALDSLRAFHDIDELRKSILDTQAIGNINEDKNSPIFQIETVLKSAKDNFDARAFNETTPKRPIKRIEDAAAKRIRIEHEENYKNGEITSPKESRSRRRLNFGETTPKISTNKTRLDSGKKFYPPKNIYKLSNMFSRIFPNESIVAHHAEADVVMLTRLMLHYGFDFVDYAEEHAIPFSKIPRLGRPNNL